MMDGLTEAMKAGSQSMITVARLSFFDEKLRTLARWAAIYSPPQFPGNLRNLKPFKVFSVNDPLTLLINVNAGILALTVH